MHHIFFIPGIMGSRLALGAEEVWPPTVSEVLGGYDRIGKLVDPAVVSTGVIEKQCVTVYKPLLDALRDAGADQGGRTFTAWHYDWRQDLATLSDALAAKFEQIVSGDPGAKISIICHSMGGLVARGALEAQEQAAATWRAKVDLVLFLATPHEGAPLALSRILGIGGSSTGLSAKQLRTLSNDERYPSGYQLLPGEDEPIVWRLDGIKPLSGQTIKQLVSDPAHGLSVKNLDAARAFRERLDPTRRPASTRYFSVASAAHTTATRLDGSPTGLKQVRPKSSGDGTVPIRSASALSVQTGFVVADHVGVAKAEESHALMLMLLGLKPVAHVPLDAAVSAAKLSVSPLTPAQGEPWEVVIALPKGTTKFEGRIIVSPQPPTRGEAHDIPISLSAEDATSLVLDGPPLPPGLYKVELQSGGTAQIENLLVSSPVET